MTKRNPRYNLRLPISIQSEFKQPYGAFLKYLLTFAEYSKFTELILEELENKNHASGEWTIRISLPLRDEFFEIKGRTMPNIDQTSFVSVLLAIFRQLEGKMTTSWTNLERNAGNEEREDDSDSNEFLMIHRKKLKLSPFNEISFSHEKVIESSVVMKPLKFDSERRKLSFVLEPNFDPFRSVSSNLPIR